MIQAIAFLITSLAGVGFFVFGFTLQIAAGLVLLALLLRWRPTTRRLGQYVELLAVFTVVSFVLTEFGIHYPYSYILILTAMMPVALLEGPWSETLLYMPGLTARFARPALIYGVLGSLALSLLLILYRPAVADNPVPAGWPVDALVILGLGFAVYVALFEETIFRSMLFARAEAAAGTTSAVFFQALFYGFLHYRSGIPKGWLGVAVMCALAIGLGWLVRTTRSVYLPILVRFLTALSVYITLLWLSRAATA